MIPYPFNGRSITMTLPGHKPKTFRTQDWLFIVPSPQLQVSADYLVSEMTKHYGAGGVGLVTFRVLIGCLTSRIHTEKP